MSSLNPTDGHLIAGTQIDACRFVGRIKAGQLFHVAPDPRDAEQPKKVDNSKELQSVAALRKVVQRFFEGAKAKNVLPYAQYLINMHAGESGLTPAMVLYSEERLNTEIDDSGRGFIQIGWAQPLIAIDGETQLAALYEAANREPAIKDDFVPVYICHGKDQAWARQVFHDLNLLGVTPSVALGIGMDARDPMTKVAGELERQIPFFTNRVNKARRQLRRRDVEVVSITTLRGACVTFAEGIAGIKFGNRPVPVDEKLLPTVTEAAVQWFTAIAELLGPAIENRDKYLAGAPGVLTAIGAMGHDLAIIPDTTARAAKITALIGRLRTVNWARGDHWDGIAGKVTPKGTFATGGIKETAYAIYGVSQ
ncbi:MAG TPA: DNA sulfur modification protein DndB [Candidatus Binataceae bacterium]|nr:DNA sulfur modification protein DndB [Candidatus Binataceae bacterium]